MNITTHAKPGNRFVLTDKGRQIGRIRVKYAPNVKGKYDYVVPVAWITEGYVKEVEDER